MDRNMYLEIINQSGLFIGKSDNSPIDLGLFFPNLPNEAVPEISMEGEFTKADLLHVAVSNLYQQGIVFKYGTWRRFLEFTECKVNDFFKNRSDHVGQIGIEILFIHTHLSAQVIYERKAVVKPTDPKEAEAVKSRLFEEFFRPAVESLLSKDFRIKCNDAESIPVREIRKFLQQPSMISAIINCVTELVDGNMRLKLDSHWIRETIESMNIWSVPKLGILRGIALRDGILICYGQLAHSSGDARYLTDLFTLALHETSQFVLRKKSANYGWRSTTSWNDAKEFRRDPVSGQRLECGRAVELAVFGGTKDGIQVNWFLSTEDAAKNFLQRAADNKTSPLYADKNECLEAGLIERTEHSYPFAGDLNFMPVLDI